MKNMSFLRPFIFFLTKLIDRSLEKDLLNLDMKVLKSNPNQYKEIIDIKYFKLFYTFKHFDTFR